MNRFHHRPIAILGLVVVLAASGALAGPKKVKAYEAQVSQTFNNTEETPAHGLKVVLSSDAIVVTHEETGAAGPFGNVSGNGKSAIVMTNPETPIPTGEGDDSSVSLVFRSYSSKLSVKSWMWPDEKSKRIGKKHKN